MEAIPEEDWNEVEVIGWLYQFYISEKKDEVIGKVVKSEARMIYEDTPAFIPVPADLQRRRSEVIVWPLDDVVPTDPLEIPEPSPPLLRPAPSAWPRIGERPCRMIFLHRSPMT